FSNAPAARSTTPTNSWPRIRKSSPSGALPNAPAMSSRSVAHTPTSRVRISTSSAPDLGASRSMTLAVPARPGMIVRAFISTASDYLLCAQAELGVHGHFRKVAGVIARIERLLVAERERQASHRCSEDPRRVLGVRWDVYELVGADLLGLVLDLHDRFALEQEV